MELKIRLTKETDYNELTDWWKWHRFPAPSIELIDNLRLGLIVSDGNENICAGFIFITNANAFGILEYVVSTYKIKNREKRKKAISFLILSLKEMAKKQGIKTIFTSVKNNNLKNHYLNTGFCIGSEGTTEMYCNI
ncbi:hypothetical protein [Tenacibaculum sp. 190524A02b]|uniref:hypothetical protein n=1 Tax=Tenacibaculum vairaonense TaxID=3137860 RepID=UPI0031FAF1AD